MARIFDVIEYPNEMKGELVHRFPEEGIGDYRIGSQVIVREAQDFFISGEVRAPGAYPARAGLTVEQALALAGGLTERGSTRRIEIKRVGEEEILKGVQLDDLVKPGDTIKVNRSIM